MLEEPNANLGTGVDDPSAAENQNPEAETVEGLKAALFAERTKRQVAEGQLSVYQTQLRMGQVAPPVQQGRQEEEVEDYLPGVEDDEPLTKKEVTKAIQTAVTKVKARSDAMSDEAAFLARHPDYEEVVTKHLPTLFETEPELLKRLQRNPDPYLAYKIGVTAPSYQAKKAKERIAADDKGKKAEENAKKPGSPSQVSGPTGQDARDKIARMNRAEFRAYMEKVKRGGR